MKEGEGAELAGIRGEGRGRERGVLFRIPFTNVMADQAQISDLTIYFV